MALRASICLGLAAVLLPGAIASAAPPQRWVHYADVDGDGVRDRVTIVAADDLTVDNNGWGSGHYTVHVALSSGGHVAKRLNASYYTSARSLWTPWFGATQIDHQGGKELVLGYTSGAHAVVFHMLTYRAGRLSVLLPPSGKDQGGWLINSSVGTGSQGWQCTSRGVRNRDVHPNSRQTAFVIDRAVYVYAGSWRRVSHVHKTAPASAQGQPPTYTDNYATFDCRGLPQRW